MTDTEILDGIAKYGISLWPDRISRTIPNASISEWNTFCRAATKDGLPVQITRMSLRAALVDTLDKLTKGNK